ncbi:Dolichyl-phosphate-mannose-protein mannosyltransferase [Trichococcus flocculiformis]|uniref:glycosyltransferase family 39 protein n=1 Tax=Trichococcus TaxID=82802 RepID=UPI0007A7EBCF|nr:MULTISPECIES: glycosyltransferase family 39 protein [Trichococcus]CZR10256.1 dolichyl-phosphate-mannose-protein mannosyltransferase [Trichococcus sp. ES5]SHG19356.1 Dolichyl-phosphate-mannose-protein mannosyltransferase [Trichococcus flocculiformis]
MTKIEEHAKKVVIFLAILSLAVIILISLFFPKLVAIQGHIRVISSIFRVAVLNGASAIIALILLSGLMYLLKIKIMNNIKLMLTIELLLYFLFMIALTKYYGIIGPIDDAWVVMDNAITLKDTGVIDGWYMVSNPQNLFLMYLYLGIEGIFNTFSYQITFIVFALMHVGSAFLVYKCAEAVSKNQISAFITMQLFIFCYQITLHVTNIYTDTLQLFIILLGLYPVLRFAESTWKNLIFSILAASVAFSVGFLAKGTTLVLIIAFVLLLVINLKGKKKILATIPIVMLLTINTSWNSFIDSQEIYQVDKIGMPNTHYIFMGLNTWYPEGNTIGQRQYFLTGAYNDGDLNYSKTLFFDQDLTKEEVQAEHIRMIKERVAGFNFKSGLEFLGAKIATSWSSGDLKSTYSVRIGAQNEKQKVNLLESYPTYIYMQSMQFLYFFIASLVFIKAFFNRIKVDPIILLSSIFTVGMFLFLIIWEASPRYVIAVMPFYMLLLTKLAPIQE